MDKRYCTNCGTFNPPDAAFCANCGGHLSGSSPQPANDPGSVPSLDEEILRKLSDLIFPITGKKLFAGGAIIILFFALIAVAVASNNHSNSAAAVTPTPTLMATTSTPTLRASPTSKPASSSAPTPKAAPKTPSKSDNSGSQNLKIGQTASSSGLQVTVSSVQKTNSYSYTIIRDYPSTDTATSGHVYLLVNCQFKNAGSDREYAEPYAFSVADSTGYKYDPSIYMGANGLSLTELYGGQHVAGVVLFEVPKTATGLTLTYDFNSLFGGDLAVWQIN